MNLALCSWLVSSCSTKQPAVADTFHRNSHSSVNDNATEMCCIPNESHWHRLSFGMLYISVALVLTELQLFL